MDENLSSKYIEQIEQDIQNIDYGVENLELDLKCIKKDIHNIRFWVRFWSIFSLVSGGIIILIYLVNIITR